ncbi:vWA domain-containing protein [Owenweeksia hongkongensis]|uniref:vWA domain-containing protein n=1 Tax=Owenweeksia hongkongensis TaxID=253245 RepID=UPI003A91B94A
MKFLYPQFLWALGVLAIPLLIHLFNFRRYTTVYFSNTRFLQNVIKQSKAINRLKQLLIMTARMFAFAMLVLAFTNPYLPATNDAETQSGWASVYVDNSPSMLSGNGQKSALNTARTKAVDIIKALPENYRVQVLTNDFSGKQQRFYSKGEAIALIDEIEVSYAGRKATDIVDRISEAQKNVSAEGLDLFWISDFQKSGFENIPNWPQGWTRSVLPLTPTVGFGNVSIDSAWFEQPVLQPNFDQELFVLLRNSGSQNAQKLPISISLDGQLQGTKEVEVPANGKAQTSFVLRPAQAKAYNGEVKIENQDPKFDNSFFFAYNVDQPFKILLTGDKSRIEKFKRLFQDSIYNLTYMPTDAIDYAQVSAFDVFIIDAPSSLPSGLIQAIEAQLKSGKNLVIFPSGEDATATNNMLSNLRLPALGNKQGASTVLDINWNDPHYKGVFSSQPNNPSLPKSTENYSYPSTVGYPLLKLANGSPLITRIPVGQGSVLLATANLENTNLISQAIFVPTMLNAALYSRSLSELYTLSGKPNGPSYESETKNDIPLSIKTEDNAIIPRQRVRNGKVEIYDIPVSLKPALYNLEQEEKKVGYLALNTNPEESQWSFLEENTIRDIFGLKSSDVLEASAGSIDYSIKQRYQGTPLWKWFLAAALFFLFVEIILIKLWK